MDQEKTSSTTIWARALDRFQDELDEKDDFQAVIEEGSLQSLLTFTQATQASAQERSSVVNMRRVGPIVKFVNDFAALIAFSCGTDPRMTALVWGSIRLLISLSSTAGDTLQDILDMLEELSLTLPRFHNYERTLPMNEAFETALFEVYTEMICLHARIIHFLRSNPHNLLRRTGWTECQGDFKRTLKRIKRLSAAVETEADLARMRAEKEKYMEVLEVVKDIKQSKRKQDDSSRHWLVPRSQTKHFRGRKAEIDAVSASFKTSQEQHTHKVTAVHGMGGVGKTQLALACAHLSRREGKDVFWIAADNPITMSRSFFEAAKTLKMLDDEEEEHETADNIQALLRFKTWLAESSRPWLLILDNATEADTVRLAMPDADRGSILLTTRDPNLARELADSTLPISPLDTSEGAQLLLRIVGQDSKLDTLLETAKDISAALGGLPLALAQIGRFIAQRKLPIQGFLALYERHRGRVDKHRDVNDDYGHTLSTVWQMSLDSLQGPAETLQKLLAFFEPDSIPEVILAEGSGLSQNKTFDFLNDEMDFSDAEQVLLQHALIDKNADDASLSVHRLIQVAVLRRMSQNELNTYFCAASRMLCWGFPDHWSKDQGHQIATWSRCEMCLPHVYYLVELCKRHEIPLQDPQGYAELLLRCSWHLYETELYTIAQSLVASALETFPSRTTPAYISALDLSGLIHLDLANFSTALSQFEHATSLRESSLPPDDPFIAFSLNNIALAKTELNDLQGAYEAHTRAIAIRTAKAPDRLGNSYSNFASLLLRMQRPAEAEKTLAMCPALKDFTDETFLSTGNPRFSGDMVLLSRIRRAQGRSDEALRLASKALAFRRRLMGARLKTCDSLCDVADLLRVQKQLAAAADLLREVCTIAETLPEGKGQLARGFWRLAGVLREAGRTNEADALTGQAWEARRKARPEMVGQEVSDEEFEDGLCLWMLW